MPALPDTFPILVVSASGSSLARSAARAGRDVIVLDLFNDMDTRALARASRVIAGATARMDARKLLREADTLCPPERCGGLVIGSGFEGRIGLLAKLARNRTLHGNPPETIARFKDPSFFFGLLDALAASHPAVSLNAPANPSGWLVKRIGGAGGAHVKTMTGRHGARPGRYFQRRVDGRSLSALFVGNGSKARIVGFNEQWTAPASRRAPFRYGGAVSLPSLPAGVTRQVESTISGLVRQTGLVGLNGLDFMLDRRGVPQILEVNPRPTATLDLHDADYPQGLFAVHLRACAGVLPEARGAHIARAHAIVYATASLRAPDVSYWPQWCTDIPQPGSAISAGAPVCSVHAQAGDDARARSLVLHRQHALAGSLVAKAA